MYRSTLHDESGGNALDVMYDCSAKYKLGI